MTERSIAYVSGISVQPMPLTVRDGFDQSIVVHHNSDEPHRNETGEETGRRNLTISSLVFAGIARSYFQWGFAAFGARAESGTGQIVAIRRLTASATTQPKITSITRRSPLSKPPIFESTDRPPAMTIAAVIGA